jgi:hypothetical protein
MVDDGDSFSTPAEQGLYDIFPDTGTYVRTSSLPGVLPSDLDAFGSGELSYLVDNSFGTIQLQADTPGLGFNLGIGVRTIGSGRDGFLYGSAFGGEFYRINPITHSSNLLGTSMPSYTGLCALPNGVMLGVAGTQLYEVDRLTGAGTPMLSLPFNMGDLACSLDGRVFGIGQVFSTGSGQLYEINMGTGAATYLMNLPVIPGLFSFFSIGSEPGSFVAADGIQLSGPASASPGSSVTLSVSGARNFSNFVLLVSTARIVTDRKTLWHGGHPFGLASPVRVFANGQTDGSGNAILSLTVPVTASGTFYLEVGLQDSAGLIHDSNELQVVVQ